ncbi:tyrosine-type recombinase/integrase [Photobacterium indicum]|nr:tyrosine-type recombinase/integrase [Photobacterium indicum]
MSKKYTGIVPNENSISMNFTYHSKLTKRTLKMRPTAANLLRAFLIRCEIVASIEKGEFDLEEFDRSRDTNKIRKETKKIETVKFYLKQFIFLESHKLSLAAIRDYTSRANGLSKEIGELPIRKLTPSKVKELFSGNYSKFSNKYKNHHVTVIRGAIRTARESGVDLKFTEDDFPCYKFTVPEPNPMEYKDLDSLMELTAEDDYIMHSFIFANLTGVRPSELAGLDRGSVDIENGTVTIDKAITLKRKFKVPKSKSSERTISLSETALFHAKMIFEYSPEVKPYDIVVIQRDNNEEKTVSFNPLIVNSNTNKHFHDLRKLNMKIKDKMTKLGFRYIPLCFARHSFASNALSLGAPAFSVANDMGHSNPALLEKHYAKFISTKPSAGVIDDYFSKKRRGKK